MIDEYIEVLELYPRKEEVITLFSLTHYLCHMFAWCPRPQVLLILDLRD